MCYHKPSPRSTHLQYWQVHICTHWRSLAKRMAMSEGPNIYTTKRLRMAQHKVACLAATVATAAHTHTCLQLSHWHARLPFHAPPCPNTYTSKLSSVSESNKLSHGTKRPMPCHASKTRRHLANKGYCHRMFTQELAGMGGVILMPNT